jgi:hypothetical protein
MKAALLLRATLSIDSKTAALEQPNHPQLHVPVFRPLALSGTSGYKPHAPWPHFPRSQSAQGRLISVRGFIISVLLS